MQKDPLLPSRATEQGIEMISLTDGLDLIRKWLPDAPDSVRITRISHRVDDDEDEFIISCDYPPIDKRTIKTLQQLRRADAAWEKHVAALQLPKLTWIDARDIKLSWHPQSLALVRSEELSTSQRVQEEFLYMSKQAICIWQLLCGKKPARFRRVLGDFAAAVSNIADLPPFISPYGYKFTQNALEDSILNAPCDWIYLLALAVSARIDTPLTRDFKKAFRVLQTNPYPDLSDLSAAIRPFVDDYPKQPFTPEQHILATEIFALASRFLDDLLTPRLQDVNTFLRACETADPAPYKKCKRPRF